MNTPPNIQDRPPISPRSLWPISIIAFFAVAILSLAGFVAYCNLHSEELVSADYYEQEVRFQGQMERVQRTQALPAKLALNYDPAARRVRLKFPAMAFDSSTAARIALYRPSAGRMDREIKLDANAGADQSFDASQMTSGLWRVRVTWTTSGQDYFVEEKLVIPAS